MPTIAKANGTWRCQEVIEVTLFGDIDAAFINSSENSGVNEVLDAKGSEPNVRHPLLSR